MIEAGREIEGLSELEHGLEHQLAQELLLPQTAQISCSQRQGQLMVLIHCLDATSTPNEVSSEVSSEALFDRIRAIIALERPSQLEGLQLYLIIHGQRMLSEEKLPEEKLSKEKETSVLARLSQSLKLSVPDLGEKLGKKTVAQRDRSRDRAIDKGLDWQTQVGHALRYWGDRPFAWPMVAIGSGLVIALAGLYALTRPCVIGSCSALPEAEQRATGAKQILRNAAAAPDLLSAQRQLNQSLGQLQAIPPWSGVYIDSQAMLRSGGYQQLLFEIDRALMALERDQQAQVLAQKTPQTPRDTEELTQLRYSALGLLEAIPAESPLSHFVQGKIQEHKSRLSQVTQDSRQNEQAIVHLHQAEQAAVLAQSRQENAKSLKDWQEVAATWQSVLQLLSQVPLGSSSYESARQSSNRYLPLWVKADKRRQLEQEAQKRYQQAIQLAKSAQTAQAQQQSSQAVIQWQQAIAQLTAIAPQSLQFNAARALLPSYRLALGQAQNQLQRKMEWQAINQELDRLCKPIPNKPTPNKPITPNSTKICDYILSDRQIRLTLTPNYLAQVWNTSLQAQAQANIPTQMAILNQVARLEQNLQLLSQKTGLPIEVYNPQGAVISSYGMR
jgi:hypothetical protein